MTFYCQEKINFLILKEEYANKCIKKQQSYDEDILRNGIHCLQSRVQFY